MSDAGLKLPTDEASAADLMVQMHGISKRFGAVLANDDVNLAVRRGTVHGIIGENGAGKSTLMSILFGFYQADSGSIAIGGQPVVIRRPDQAIAAGIGMVHQHFMLVDTLSALHNVMIGSEPHWQLRHAEQVVRAKLQTLMTQTGLELALDARVSDLSVGDRQRLELLKLLYRGAKVLILDEPTAVLTPQETLGLFELLRRLRAQGTTILLITHKLKEVMALCDEVTVMRGGRVVEVVPIAQASVGGLAQAMVGRAVASGRPDAPAAKPGAVVLQAQGLSVQDRLKVTRLAALDLDLRAGEIVGVAGVAGNGQSELLALLSGLDQPSEGTLSLGGQRFTAGAWLDPARARTLGLAHVPEDRLARALVLGFSAWESAILGYDGLPAYQRHGWLLRRRVRESTQYMMRAFDVRPPHTELRSSKFSGGNQQKLVLARELGQRPRVLLVGQPTRGVDIGAIEFIHGQLRAARDAGCAVLVVSSELDEIFALADRILVMHQGRIVGDMPVAECSESSVGLLMGGSHP